MTLAHPKPMRAPRPRRAIKRTKRPRKVRKTTRGQMGRKADALFSLIVRARGGCVAASRLIETTVGDEGELIAVRDHSCAGPLQCAHIVSRRYRSTRWDEDNAVPLCAGAHRYFTDRQCEWDMFVERYLLTQTAYDEMRYYRALRKWDGDIESVLVRLAARAVALGIKA